MEATQAYLERIEAVDGQLNSYITVCGDEALAQARQAEEDISAGRYAGPMHGIPVAVKDQFNTQGILTTNGSTIHGNFVPDEGRDGYRQPEAGRSGAAGQAEHERVRQRRRLPPSLRAAEESLGPVAGTRGTSSSGSGGGDSGFPVLDVAGRGHGRVHTGAGVPFAGWRESVPAGGG